MSGIPVRLASISVNEKIRSKWYGTLHSVRRDDSAWRDQQSKVEESVKVYKLILCLNLEGNSFKLLKNQRADRTILASDAINRYICLVINLLSI